MYRWSPIKLWNLRNVLLCLIGHGFFFMARVAHPKISVFICRQFRRGEWPLRQLQPPGPPGVSRLWPGPPHQLPQSQPAARVLPVPLWQRLWPVPQIHVTQLLHRLWTVSTGHVHRIKAWHNSCDFCGFSVVNILHEEMTLLMFVCLTIKMM